MADDKSSTKKSNQKQLPEDGKNKKIISDLFAQIGELLVGFSIPFGLGLIVWLFIVDQFRLYRWNQYAISIAFIIAVPILSLIFSASISVFSNWYQKAVVPPAKRRQTVTKGKKLIKIIVAGIIIPILLSFAANLIPVSNNQDTFLTIMVKTIRARAEYSFISDIGEAVISAKNIDTKVSGVNTLDTINSDGSLEQLLRIVEADSHLLDKWDYYDATANALASFELRGRNQLLELFHKYEQQALSQGGDIQPDIHSRFFEQSFQSLRTQLEDKTLEPEKRKEILLRLEEIELELKRNLDDLEEAEEVVSTGRQPILLLVMDSFLRMNSLKEDEEIYFLARKIATDPSYPSQVRGKAILLVAKLGDNDDFPILIPHLQGDDEILKKSTLEGIAILHNKLNGLEEEDEGKQ